MSNTQRHTLNASSIMPSLTLDDLERNVSLLTGLGFGFLITSSSPGKK
jgi:hypothetical protein